MFFDNYQALCIKKGVSPSAAAKEIGVNPSSMTGWSKGALPRMATARKIADYFGVTTDDLMNSENIVEKYEIDQELRKVNERNSEQKEKPTVTSGSELSPDEIVLIKLYRASSPERRALAFEEALKILKESLG